MGSSSLGQPSFLWAESTHARLLQWPAQLEAMPTPRCGLPSQNRAVIQGRGWDRAKLSFGPIVPWSQGIPAASLRPSGGHICLSAGCPGPRHKWTGWPLSIYLHTQVSPLQCLCYTFSQTFFVCASFLF